MNISLRFWLFSLSVDQIGYAINISDCCFFHINLIIIVVVHVCADDGCVSVLWELFYKVLVRLSARNVFSRGTDVFGT